MGNIPDNNYHNILEWNCQGVGSKTFELFDIVSRYKPCVLALQETKLWVGKNFKVAGYNGVIREGHYNNTTLQRALYVHQSTPYTILQINTNIPAITIHVQLGILVTICLLYSSRNHELTENLLHVIRQLLLPLIILGNLNADHARWGCTTTDERGTVGNNIISNGNLNISILENPLV